MAGLLECNRVTRAAANLPEKIDVPITCFCQRDPSWREAIGEVSSVGDG